MYHTGTTEKIVRPKVKTERKICSIAECGKHCWRKSYCHRHYKEIVLNYFPKPRGHHKKIEKEPCSVAFCDRNATPKGMCRMHYVRFKKYGNPNVNYANNHRRTAKNITNNELKFTHSHEEVMILNEFFEEAIGFSRYNEE
jgi:hypothetical protein